jgi:predicted anti-sigma-YlaC factor YlaD
MTENEKEQMSCDQIITLLNELVDGNMTNEREKKAQELILENPQCRNLYTTLKKTIELYRQRRNEISEDHSPQIHWDQIREKSTLPPEQPPQDE